MQALSLRTFCVTGVIALAAGVASCVPNRRAQANEVMAQGGLRAIARAQTKYALTCGNGSFTASFKALRTKGKDQPDPFLAEPFTDADVQEHNGYRMRLTPGAGSRTGEPDCNGSPTITAFYASAEPVNDGTGTKSFATSEGNTLWELKGSKAPAEPFGAPAMPVQ
jgi:hypothetical protein